MTKRPTSRKRPQEAGTHPVRSLTHVERLEVRIDIDGETRLVGKLAWKATERRAYFEYHRDFLAAPLPLSPFRLPVAFGVKAAPYEPFEGLHGLFNDSLPDGWGRKLLDRRLQKEGYYYLVLSPLDRLAFVGETGMGALRYIPERTFGHSSAKEIDLDWLADQAELVQQEISAADVDLLQAAQGGSGGVRPKVMVGLNANTNRIVADVGQPLPPGFEQWIVKFRSTEDPREIGAEEFAYSLMARDAGVDIPETRIIATKNGGRYFAAKRFDRTATSRNHIQTASGLLEANHRIPSIEYGTLLKLTHVLTRDARAVRQMFRRMVFNVLARNRDDHAKNHAFLMDPDGLWHPTPAYDLTFSTGPGGEHNLAVAGEGRAPGLLHILKVASDAAISQSEAEAIVDHVRSVVNRWPQFAEVADLSEQRTAELDSILNGRKPQPQASIAAASPH